MRGEWWFRCDKQAGDGRILLCGRLWQFLRVWSFLAGPRPVGKSASESFAMPNRGGRRILRQRPMQDAEWRLPVSKLKIECHGFQLLWGDREICVAFAP